MNDDTLKYKWWFAHHRASCGAAELKLTCQFGKEAILLVILCSRCDESIRGFVSDSNWALVVPLLDNTRES